MSAKLLVLFGFLGLLVVATLTLVLVVTGADRQGGHTGVFWFLLCGFMIVFLGFLLCWSQRPRPVARYAARYLSSLEEDLTPEEGAAILKRYSPLLLVTALLYLAGSIVALFFY